MKNLIVLSVLLVLFPGCASLIMSTADRDEKKESIVLSKQDEATVTIPIIDEKLLPEIKDGGFTVQQFATLIQQNVVNELKIAGVNAIANETETASTLRINIDRYERGSGFFRLFPLFGLGDSYLGGVAILSTPQGKREIEVSKVGQLTGPGQLGDQTEANIGYFARALTSKITK